MSDAAEEKRADEARAALLSDIRELKEEGSAAVEKVESNLPWLAGGAVGVVALGVAIAVAAKPRRSAFAASRARPSLAGKLLRAAALAAIGYGTRRVVVSALDKVLPERQPNPAR